MRNSTERRPSTITNPHTVGGRAKIRSSEWSGLLFLRKGNQTFGVCVYPSNFLRMLPVLIILSNMVATGHMWLFKLIKIKFKIQSLNHTNHISRALCSHGARGLLSCIAHMLHAQSCPTLCDLMDYSPPDSSVHGNSPGKDTGVGCHALLQGIFSTQRSNPCLLHWQANFLPLRHQGSPDT